TAQRRSPFYGLRAGGACRRRAFQGRFDCGQPDRRSRARRREHDVVRRTAGPLGGNPPTLFGFQHVVEVNRAGIAEWASNLLSQYCAGLRILAIGLNPLGKEILGGNPNRPFSWLMDGRDGVGADSPISQRRNDPATVALVS